MPFLIGGVCGMEMGDMVGMFRTISSAVISMLPFSLI